jgi:RNA polymerase sigma-70 factor (ECF subfamily)
LSPQIADRLPSPYDHAEQRERDRVVQAALDTLPPDYRMAVVLRYFEGLGWDEIARAMGLTVKAVERLLARARETLEPHLRPLVEE